MSQGRDLGELAARNRNRRRDGDSTAGTASDLCLHQRFRLDRRTEVFLHLRRRLERVLDHGGAPVDVFGGLPGTLMQNRSLLASGAGRGMTVAAFDRIVSTEVRSGSARVDQIPFPGERRPMCAPAGHCAGRTATRKGRSKVRAPAGLQRSLAEHSLGLVDEREHRPDERRHQCRAPQVAGSMVDVTNGLVSVVSQ